MEAVLESVIQTEKTELYCPFCEEDIGNPSNFTWDKRRMMNESGKEVILCRPLYHGNSITLKDGTVIEYDGLNFFVHFEHCKQYCLKDTSKRCPNDLWHLKNY